MKKIFSLAVIFTIVFVNLSFAGNYIDPDNYNIPKDGVTDSTPYWTVMIASLEDGDTIVLPPGAKYLVDMYEGIIFDVTVRIIGSEAEFIAGSYIYNYPMITFEADKSRIENCTITCTANHTDGNNDNFQEEQDSLLINNRSGIRFLGDNSVCSNVKFVNCVVGVTALTAKYLKIDNCSFANDIIHSETVEANNYHSAIYIKNSDNCRIFNNDITGHGQGVLISESFGIIVENNKIQGSSNNGIYLSSGGESFIENNIVSFFDSCGIKCRGSDNKVANNIVRCSVANGSIGGISVTGNGPGDENDFNGENTIVSNNTISGDSLAGISVGLQDGYSIRNPNLINNTITFVENPIKPCYGIHFNGVYTDSCIIEKNTISGGHSFGILMNVATERTHTHGIISKNIAIGGTNDAFSFTGLQNSLIINNIGKNCVTGRTGLCLNDSSNNEVSINDFGDDQEIHTQKYGIEEMGASESNKYIYNNTEGCLVEYKNINENSVIVGL